MGDRVVPRQEFIETYGPQLNLTDLDIQSAISYLPSFCSLNCLEISGKLLLDYDAST